MPSPTPTKRSAEAGAGHLCAARLGPFLRKRITTPPSPTFNEAISASIRTKPSPLIWAGARPMSGRASYERAIATLDKAAELERDNSAVYYRRGEPTASKAMLTAPSPITRKQFAWTRLRGRLRRPLRRQTPRRNATILAMKDCGRSSADGAEGRGDPHQVTQGSWPTAANRPKPWKRSKEGSVADASKGEATELRASIHFTLGKTAEALDDLQRGHPPRYRDTRASYDGRGAVYEKMGSRPLALADYRKGHQPGGCGARTAQSPAPRPRTGHRAGGWDCRG